MQRWGMAMAGSLSELKKRTGRTVGVLAAAALTFASSYASSAPRIIDGWLVVDSVSPLTNMAKVIALRNSEGFVQNQLGMSVRAVLVLRCAEGKFAFYVVWPSILYDSMGPDYTNSTMTPVLYKIDDGAIKSDSWALDDNGNSAGGFDNPWALTMIETVVGHRRLVVRLMGKAVEDAEFRLDGVDHVAWEIGRACGQDIPGASPEGPVAAPLTASPGAPGAEGPKGAATAATVAPAPGAQPSRPKHHCPVTVSTDPGQAC
jgi:hypothetical protein